MDNSGLLMLDLIGPLRAAREDFNPDFFIKTAPLGRRLRR
jgi:hypothetical protein